MKRVLVAEDNPANRELIREILELCGCQVLEAADGIEAVEIARQTRPDLVLLDIQMPHLDGYQVVRMLRADPAFTGLPVVAVTAFAMAGDREKALAAGFDEYLTKPVGLRRLQAELERWLGCRAG